MPPASTRLFRRIIVVIVAMSVRNFERVFTREVGATPSHYVLQMRVEAAWRQLERNGGGLKHVASSVGFGNADVMRRAFIPLLGVAPRRYRDLAEHRRRVTTEADTVPRERRHLPIWRTKKTS